MQLGQIILTEESVMQQCSKLLLKFATASVIESLRRNPELCNFVLYNIADNNTTYRSNYPSLMSSGQQRQQSFNDVYTALIIEEAEKLYNDLTTKLTNAVIAATSAMKASSSLPTDNNVYKLTTRNYNNDQEQPNE